MVERRRKAGGLLVGLGSFRVVLVAFVVGFPLASCSRLVVLVCLLLSIVFLLATITHDR